jgi:hypothetical protein
VSNKCSPAPPPGGQEDLTCVSRVPKPYVELDDEAGRCYKHSVRYTDSSNYNRWDLGA